MTLCGNVAASTRWNKFGSRSFDGKNLSRRKRSSQNVCLRFGHSNFFEQTDSNCGCSSPRKRCQKANSPLRCRTPRLRNARAWFRNTHAARTISSIGTISLAGILLARMPDCGRNSLIEPALLSFQHRRPRFRAISVAVRKRRRPSQGLSLISFPAATRQICALAGFGRLRDRVEKRNTTNCTCDFRYPVRG